MNKALTYELWESFDDLGGIRYPEQIKVDDHDKSWIRKLNWRDLDWKEIGDNSRNIVWLELNIPLETDLYKGIAVDIQIIKGTFYQIHISLAEDLRGLGLGTKIYRSLVDWLGHIYSGKGRRQNPIIDKVWDKLRNSYGVTCKSNELGDICVSDKNPIKQELLTVFN